MRSIASSHDEVLGAGGEIYNREDGVLGVDYEEDIGKQRVSSFRQWWTKRRRAPKRTWQMH